MVMVVKDSLISECINAFLVREFSQNFSLEKLDSLGYYDDKEKYCNECFGGPIGKGGHRLVYDYSEDKVIKLAMNPTSAVDENKREWINYKHHCIDMPNQFSNNDDMRDYTNNMAKLFPLCYSHAKDWSWLLVEQVFPIHKEDFKKVLGIPYSTGVIRDKQYQPTEEFNKSRMKFNASKYAEDRAMKELGSQNMYNREWYDAINKYKNEFYAKYGLHPSDDTSNGELTYDDYDKGMYTNSRWNIDKHMMGDEFNEDNFHPSVMGFIEWCEGDRYNVSVEDEAYYRNIAVSHPWFSSFKSYMTSSKTKEFNRDMIFDNFGLAQRNGQPWIVILDSGRDVDTYTPFNLRQNKI